MKYEHYPCQIAIGSVTEAMKAQRVLSGAAIPSDVIKVDKAGRYGGCIYGISFMCAQEKNVRSLLYSYGISVKEGD